MRRRKASVGSAMYKLGALSLKSMKSRKTSESALNVLDDPSTHADLSVQSSPCPFTDEQLGKLFLIALLLTLTHRAWPLRVKPMSLGTRQTCTCISPACFVSSCDSGMLHVAKQTHCSLFRTHCTAACSGLHCTAACSGRTAPHLVPEALDRILFRTCCTAGCSGHTAAFSAHSGVRATCHMLPARKSGLE